MSTNDQGFAARDLHGADSLGLLGEKPTRGVFNAQTYQAPWAAIYDSSAARTLTTGVVTARIYDSVNISEPSEGLATGKRAGQPTMNGTFAAGQIVGENEYYRLMPGSGIIRIKKPGAYIVSVGIGFTTGATGAGYREASIEIGSATGDGTLGAVGTGYRIWNDVRSPVNAGGTFYFRTTASVPFFYGSTLFTGTSQAGVDLRAYGFQDSGVAGNFEANGSSNSAMFQIVRIGNV